MRDFWELVPANPWERGPGLLPRPNGSAQLPGWTPTTPQTWELRPPDLDYLAGSPFELPLRDSPRRLDQQSGQSGPLSGGIFGSQSPAENPQGPYRGTSQQWNGAADPIYANAKRALDFALSLSGTPSLATQAYGPSSTLEFAGPGVTSSSKALTGQEVAGSARVIPSAQYASTETGGSPSVQSADARLMLPQSNGAQDDTPSGNPSHPNRVEEGADDSVNAETGFAPGQTQALADFYRRVLSDVGSYLSNSAYSLSRIPSGIGEMARDLFTDPLLFLQRAEPGFAGMGMAVPPRVAASGLATEIGRVRTNRLEARAREIWDVLDQIARKQRVTAVLATNGKTIVASGGRDLEKKQKLLLGPSELPARLPDEHGEITALFAAKKKGFIPRAIATTKPMCIDCAIEIEKAGGRLTSPTTAIFPSW
jgi:hypothetical protein